MIRQNPAISGHLLGLFLLLPFFSTSTFGQTSSSSTQLTTFKDLESNIQHNKALNETAQKLKQLKFQAIANKDDITQARSLYDLLMIRDSQTEDTLYFQNSAYMDTLIESRNSSPRLRALMYVLRAQRIGGFDQNYRRFNTGAYKRKALKIDYAALTSDQRAALVHEDFEASFKLAAVKVPLEELSWLPDNLEAFAFQADFEDGLRSMQVASLERQYTQLAQLQGRSGAWLKLSSATFRNKLDSLAAAANPQHSTALIAYRNWIHARQHNPEKSTFIETLARQYIYQYSAPDSAEKQNHISYLQKNSQSTLESIKLQALYQLSLIWNDEGNKNRGKAAEQPHRKKALELYEAHAAAFKKYPVYDLPLADMAKQIRAAGVQVEMDDKVQPNQQIPIQVDYRNSDTIFYSILAMPAEVQNRSNSLTAEGVWLQQRPIKEGNFALNLPEDYQLHTAMLNLPALPIGWYRLIFRNKTLLGAGDDLNMLTFQVTSIAAIHDDSKLFVLDRSTGVPLAGARVYVLKGKQSGKQARVLKVASDGHIDMPAEPGDSVRIIYQGDTLNYSYPRYGMKRSDKVFNKDEYDDLNEFYTEHVRMEVFTDRSIYRPGQTVHYKAIFFTKHKLTGHPMLLNKENLGSSHFKRWVETMLNDKSNKIELTDPFGKVADSSYFMMNDFASFAGSFLLPKSAAVGAWKIGDQEQYDSNNTGSFQVEEYKRPSIELSMDKQRKLILPGEDFQVALKVRTFSGATLKNIPITYAITRNFYHPYDLRGGKLYKDVPVSLKLADTTTYTDEKGNLSVSITDPELRKLKIDDEQSFQINYSIVAKAVDATGEVSELAENISLSSHPIQIEAAVADTYDRQVLPVFSVKTTNPFEGVLKRDVRVQLFRQGNTRMDTNSVRTLIIDTVVSTGSGGRVILPKEKVVTGYYQLLLSTKDDKITRGVAAFNFTVFDSKSTEIPTVDVEYISSTTARPGEMVTWYSAGKQDNYTIYQALYTNGKQFERAISSYQTRMEKPGLRSWSFRVPNGTKGLLVLQRISVFHNVIQKHQKSVVIVSDEVFEAPELVVEKYRRVLAPGAKETVKIALKTKNVKVAAELLTTIYDATLDKLNQHRWRRPSTDVPLLHPESSWSYAVANTQQRGDAAANDLWITVRKFGTTNTMDLLAGRVMGVGINKEQALSMVEIGYGNSLQEIRVRGNTNLPKDGQVLVVVDGQVFAGNINSIDQSTIRDMIVLKDAEALAIYGSAAANGAILISTSGKIVLPEGAAAPVKIRKDFSETAFFKPQIHADADGNFSFSYTMPESATTWNWKMLAHTSKGKFAYLEKTIQTQLKLMVQANMPRFLYQGDKFVLQSRVSNLDTLNISGTAKLKIEDVVTGEDLTSLVTAQDVTTFNIAGNSSTVISYALHIPAKQANPLKVIVTASNGFSADAEEHMLPILSTRVFLQKRQQLQFDGKESVAVKSANLPADATLQGIGISIDQKPSATLLYALPWLANNSSAGAEQVFDKLRAQVMAISLLQQDTALQAVFRKSEALPISTGDNAGFLPKELSTDQMPWLGLSQHVATQQRQLRELLNPASVANVVSKQLNTLYKLQNAEGGMAWFNGGQSNADVSAYVLAGFGQLQEHSATMDFVNDQQFTSFLQRLVTYHGQMVIKGQTEVPGLYQLYALSFWLEAYPLAPAQRIAVNELLSKKWLHVRQMDLQQQALLIINTIRFSAPENSIREKAYQQLEDIQQLAIVDQQNGLRWKAIADGEDMDRSAEETMALLAEAFEISGNHKGLDAKLLKWLMTTKEGEHWQTTAGTAAALTLLHKQKLAFTSTSTFLNASIDAQKLRVSDDLLQGNPMDYMAARTVPKSIMTSASGTETRGALTWYYFASPSQLDTLNKGLSITKTMYVWQKAQGWAPLSLSTILNAGDRVQVRLKVESATNLKFVHVKDTRAAAFEPQEVQSGYQFAGRLRYYQGLRDTGLDIFAELLPRGITEFKYDLVVAQSGMFHSAPATVQSMHKPGIMAYSGTASVSTK